MPFIIADRVRESSTTTGTGNIALGGAVVGYQTFDAVLNTSDTTYYVFADQAGGPNWEVGIGTFTAPSTLARTTVLSSSNGGSLVNFTAGAKDVFISLPASRTVQSFSAGTTGFTPSTDSYGAITLSGTLAAANGGTGQSSYAVGDILFASGTTALSKLADVATGNALISGGIGVAPSYGKIGLTTHVSGILPIVNGGTNASTASAGFDNLAPTTTAGDIIYRGASSNTRLAAGTATQVLIGGTVPSWGAVSLTTMVSGTLPIANGGTNSTTASGALTNLGGVAKAGDTMTGALAFVAGTVSAPGLTFSGDTNTGIYSPAADTIGFVEGGVEAMRLDASGNVGIGTSSPSSFGKFAVTGSAGTVFVGSSGQNIVFTNGGTNFITTQTAGGQLQFQTGAGSNAMIIDASGNVGIGTSSPTQRLTVSGQITSSVAGASILQTATDTTNSINWQVGSDGSNIYAGTQTNHSLRIVTNNSERMRVASNSSDVAIGIASFYYQSANRSTLTVAGATDALVAIGGGGVASGYLYGTSTVLNVTADNKTLQLAAGGANPIVSITNGAERFRVGPSGQFGIGGANYGTAGQVLTSNGAAAAPSWQNAAANGLLLNVQVFTSSGTYTRTAGVTRAVVIAVGGGGGSGASGGGNGGTGGTTSFGSHVTAVGGVGGVGASGGAAGGAGGSGGTGALLAIRGAPGENTGGNGGGQGGGSSSGPVGVRGGGASGNATGGGGGGQGETAIDYITSVGATETVTIGAGGTGGVSGGSAGGAGYIIVYEYS